MFVSHAEAILEVYFGTLSVDIPPLMYQGPFDYPPSCIPHSPELNAAAVLGTNSPVSHEKKESGPIFIYEGNPGDGRPRIERPNPPA